MLSPMPASLLQSSLHLSVALVEEVIFAFGGSRCGRLGLLTAASTLAVGRMIDVGPLVGFVVLFEMREGDQVELGEGEKKGMRERHTPAHPSQV